jgi:hypothetical protein
MSLEPDRDRRLYCVIDELPTLQKLPSLSDFLARARKYGGCGILGFQSYPQLEATYGIQDAAAITGYCSTWVALRANDTPTAKHVSENLGQVEQVEANEGMSYGVNDMRDGVNLSRMQVTRPLVLHTEVTNLPNLTGYLRFGRSLPVVRFEDSFNKVPSISVAFRERVTPPTRISMAQDDQAPMPLAGKEPEHSKAARKSRRTRPIDHSPELPLETGLAAAEGEERDVGRETGGADMAGETPGITLYGRPAGFRLRQHGRHSGSRDAAKPA